MWLLCLHIAYNWLFYIWLPYVWLFFQLLIKAVMNIFCCYFQKSLIYIAVKEKFWISHLRPYFFRILSWCNELRTATLLSDSVGVKIQEICVSHNSLSLVWNFFVLNEMKTVCRWTRWETSVIEVVRFVTRWVVYH